MNHRLLILITTLWVAFSCQDSPQNPPQDPTFSLPEGPAALSLSGDSLYATPPSEELIAKWAGHKTAFEGGSSEPR